VLVNQSLSRKPAKQTPSKQIKVAYLADRNVAPSLVQSSLEARPKTSPEPVEINFDPIEAEEEALLEIENVVLSHGDTVHYAERPKIFETCSGRYL